MNFDKNLQLFQDFLKKNNIDFYLVFSNDEFLKESSNLNENARYLLSGFTGSAGDMLVTPDKAYLFVDGRYHIQVDDQTNTVFITPIKLQMGEKRNDKIFEIVKKSGIKNPKFALPSNKISVAGFEALDKKLCKLNVEFLKSSEDDVCKFFATKFEENVYKVWNVGIKQVGKTSAAKLKELSKYENDFLLVFSNDEVCYLANIRANQNPYSSSLNAFALLGRNVLYIFCDTQKLADEVKVVSDNLVYRDFCDFHTIVQSIDGAIFYEPAKVPLSILEQMQNANLILRQIKVSPVSKMKSRKNAKEMKYIEECYHKSDIALLETINFLQSNLAKNKKIRLGEFMEKLVSNQQKQGVVGLSFNPILAINERSAIIHCTEFDKNQFIKNGDLILLDFGVYFEGGYATDMTRTFVAGDKYGNELMKKVYTTVLKAFLNTLNYPIKKETTFFDLDKKARTVIKRAKLEGFNFNHGTGHGIGLNVHEMPPVLSSSNLAKKKLQAGMVFSIEPGLYRENVGGVRLENSVCTIKTKDGIKIKSLTNLPFDEKLIIFDLLTKKEKICFEEYQKRALK